MSRMLSFMKATLIGGLVFLLPIGVVIVVLGKLLEISRKAGELAHDRLFPGIESPVIPLVLAVAILLMIALAAGLFARTPTGVRVFLRLEKLALARLPAYTLLRQMISDIAGGADSLCGRANAKVVKVRFDDSVQVGFLIEDKPGSDPIVFLPGAPSPLSGAVVLVEKTRICETSLTPELVLTSMRRLGFGLAEKTAMSNAADESAR